MVSVLSTSVCCPQGKCGHVDVEDLRARPRPPSTNPSVFIDFHRDEHFSPCLRQLSRLVARGRRLEWTDNERPESRGRCPIDGCRRCLSSESRRRKTPEKNPLSSRPAARVAVCTIRAFVDERILVQTWRLCDGTHEAIGTFRVNCC